MRRPLWRDRYLDLTLEGMTLNTKNLILQAAGLAFFGLMAVGGAPLASADGSPTIVHVDPIKVGTGTLNLGVQQAVTNAFSVGFVASKRDVTTAELAEQVSDWSVDSRIYFNHVARSSFFVAVGYGRGASDKTLLTEGDAGTTEAKSWESYKSHVGYQYVTYAGFHLSGSVGAKTTVMAQPELADQPAAIGIGHQVHSGMTGDYALGIGFSF